MGSISIAIRALDVLGEKSQIDQTIEECAELIVALQHFKRKRVSKEEVAEEIADVQIMTEQMTILFCGQAALDKIKEQKYERLRERLSV